MVVFVITYCSEIDKRKLPPVTLGAASSTAVITGWGLFFIGNYIEDKNHNLYLNLSNGESIDKYYGEMINGQKISKCGLWTQGFGGLFLGISFWWRYRINKSALNENTFQSNTAIIPFITYDCYKITVYYSF
jgi:hypothetical protein